jgi:1,4-dihydroxy-2-naphthoate octaprenyltransferase
MSVPIGLLIVNILVVNNLRDIDVDKAANKITMAVRMGIPATRIEYLILLGISYLILPLLIWMRLAPVWTLLVWLSLPLAWKVAQTVLNETGRPLNEALAGTGKISLIYSILFFVGILLAKLLKMKSHATSVIYVLDQKVDSQPPFFIPQIAIYTVDAQANLQ